MPGIQQEIRGRLFKAIDRYSMRTEDGDYVDINEWLSRFDGQSVKIAAEEVRDKGDNRYFRVDILCRL